MTGFARPGTQAIRPSTGVTSVGALQRILTASRGSTARPATAAGRFAYHNHLIYYIKYTYLYLNNNNNFIIKSCSSWNSINPRSSTWCTS